MVLDSSSRMKTLFDETQTVSCIVEETHLLLTLTSSKRVIGLSLSPGKRCSPGKKWSPGKNDTQKLLISNSRNGVQVRNGCVSMHEHKRRFLSSNLYHFHRN